MKEIQIHPISRRAHCDQIITGFLMLRERLGRERFPLRFERIEGHPDANIPLVEVIADAKKIYYDTEDSYWTTSHMQAILNQCDMYFKRSYSEAENESRLTEEQARKIHPLGLGYEVHDDSVNFFTFKRLYGRYSCPWNIVYSRDIEAPPSLNLSPKILFFTRLWDPSLAREKYRDDRSQVSVNRIRLLRMLKKYYPEQFTGGLSDSPYARNCAPDLILPHSKTRRRAYLKAMRSADICITSTGLHGSAGWKFGEYVAASRAVLSEKLLYEIPGDFTDGKNYLSYSTPDECLEKVGHLLRNPDILHRIQHENMEYYHTFLRPDKLIENSLIRAGVRF